MANEFYYASLLTFMQQAVQEQELALVREYETKLLAREEQNASESLSKSTEISDAVARISDLLRKLLYAQTGEECVTPSTEMDELDDREPWTVGLMAEQALERETELARLEKENEELRRMIGLLPPHPRRPTMEYGSSMDSRPPMQRVQTHYRLPSGGGPFGTSRGMRTTN